MGFPDASSRRRTRGSPSALGRRRWGRDCGICSLRGPLTGVRSSGSRHTSLRGGSRKPSRRPALHPFGGGGCPRSASCGSRSGWRCSEISRSTPWSGILRSLCLQGVAQRQRAVGFRVLASDWARAPFSDSSSGRVRSGPAEPRWSTPGAGTPSSASMGPRCVSRIRRRTASTSAVDGAAAERAGTRRCTS